MMKKLFILLTLSIYLMNFGFAQKAYKSEKPAYVIYNKKGKRVSYDEMVKELAKHDICLFGELHDCSVSHWMEKIVTKDLLKIKGRENFMVGGEMWEADQQLLMDEFTLYGLVDKKGYVAAAKNWPNFRDYKPLVGIALRNNLKFVCSNIPRRYANIIYKKGLNYLDSLPQEAYKYLPARPIHFNLEEKCYKDMGSVFGPDADHTTKKAAKKTFSAMSNFKGSNLVRAQAIKDATMAYRILKFWKKGKFMIHYNGVYHSMNDSAICYYLRFYNPEVDYVTISVSRQANVLELQEGNNTGDFNIVVDESLPTSY